MKNQVHRLFGVGVVALIALAVFLRQDPTVIEPEPKTSPPAPLAGRPGVSRPAPPSVAPAPDPRPATARSPSIAPVSPETEAQLRRAFQGFRKAHHAAILKHGLAGGFFQSDRLLFLREARLFAAAYPDLAESVASVDARDAALDWRERHYAIHLLGSLAVGAFPRLITTQLMNNQIRAAQTEIEAMKRLKMVTVTGP